MRRWVIVVLALIGVTGVSSAQDEATLTGTPVEITASTDEMVLKGETFAPADSAEMLPAVLLLHQNNGRRSDWLPLIPTLTGAGYLVLAVDMRGFGETGGRTNWVAAQQDALDWTAFLRDDAIVDDARIAIIGASVGSNMALVGCAADEACVGAVALSPSLGYLGVAPLDAVVEGLAERSVLLVSSQRDGQSALGTRMMANESRGDITLRMYAGSTHGTGLLATNGDALIALIADWLDEVFTVTAER